MSHTSFCDDTKLGNESFGDKISAAQKIRDASIAINDPKGDVC